MPGFLLSLALSTSAIADQQGLIRFQHVDPEQSFASRYILAVAQDERGFLWFASLYGGLARFDGYDFKIYKHDPSDPTSLPTNEVHSLLPDRQGGIWIGTAEGLAWLDTVSDRMTVYQHDPEDPGSLSHSGVAPILLDNQGVLWVGTENGINRKEPGSHKFKHYPLLFENTDRNIITPARWVWCLFEDSSGELWAGTLGGGLLRYDRNRDEFERILNDSEDPNSLPSNVVRTIAEDDNGQLWVGGLADLAKLTGRNPWRFERVAVRSQFPELNLPGVQALLFDRTGAMWASLSDAVVTRPPDASGFQLIRHVPSDPDSLGSGRIWTLFEDRAGLLWVPSDTISWLVPTQRAISIYPRDLSSLSDHDSLLLDSSGRLWTGTRNGVVGLALESEEWQSHVPFPGTEGTSENWVSGHGIYEDPSGALWVTTSRRLSRFNPDDGTFASIDLPAEPNAMTLGSDGAMWMGLPFQGLASLDLASQELTIFKPDESDPDSVSHNFGYAVIEDSKGRLWYGTQHGLNLFDRDTGKAKRYYSEAGTPDSLSNNTVRQVFEDSSGRLWFGTQYGLNLLKSDGSGFVRYFNGDSASDNVFTSIVSFGDRNLWLATDRGIAKLDTDTGEFANYSHADGLPSDFRRVLQAGDNGILYAVSRGGFIAIDTTQLDYRADPPPVVLTEFRLFNRPVPVSVEESSTVLPANIDSLSHLTLAHRDSLISFKFSALDYFDPNQNAYQYLLEGLHDRWISTDAANRWATFTDLPAGNYRLRIRGANRAGVWNEADTSLGITVRPPLWQTWWAYTLYALAFMAIPTAFVRWRTRLLRIRSGELKVAVAERTEQLAASEQTVREQAANLQNLLALKERLFTNISHEFRTPLTLMLGPIDNAIEESQSSRVIAQLEMARRNGKRVLRLVDQLLELSRLSADEPLQLMPQPLKPLVEAVSEAFRPYARDKGIMLSVMSEEQLWANCSAEAIERILMNLLSNALKFTPSGGRVNVVLREHEGTDAEPGTVELQVFDTGKGIPKDQQGGVFERFRRGDDLGEAIPGSGIGLALVKELVDAHRGRIGLQSEPGKGTVVTILLSPHTVKPGVEMVTEPQPSDALKLEVDVLEQPVESIGDDADDETSGRPRLLIIEDNRDMQYYLSQLLSAFYRVELAGDGAAGLEYAREEIPDLVICDVMLPQQDGYQVAHELKSDQRTSHIPIIMLTARTDEDSRLEGLREHVDDYLTKPFNDEELMLRIANLLAIRDILKARYSGQLNSGEDPRTQLSEPEQRFLERLEQVMEANHADHDFSIADMASALALSPRQLQRKLKALTDQQPIHYLRLYRLVRSLDLLRKGKLIGDVAYSVGFGSPAHFSSCFRAQYGCTPTEFQQRSPSVDSG